MARCPVCEFWSKSPRWWQICMKTSQKQQIACKLNRSQTDKFTGALNTVYQTILRVFLPHSKDNHFFNFEKNVRTKKHSLYKPIFLAGSLPLSTETSLVWADGVAPEPEVLRPLGLPKDTKSAFSISKCLKRLIKNFPHRGVWRGSIRCNIRQVWINSRRSRGTASYWCSIHL